MAARNDDTRSIREIAELTARLRRLSAAGRAADPAERAAFLADKDALIARIETATRTADAAPVQDEYAGAGYAGAGYAGAEAAVMARAAAGGYAMVGPSARTWSVDPATGIPAGPVPETEHRLVRDLIARERLDGAEPVWLRCADGGAEIVAAVVPARADGDDPVEARAAVDDLSVADPDATAQPAPAERVGQDDGWFSGGYHTAHTAYLDARGHTSALPGEPADDVVDGRLSPPPMPAVMLDGIEERRTGPAEWDDPAELDARLAQLRDRISASVGEPAGGWHTVSAEAAARELAGRGTDLDTARTVVTDYLRETSERVGAPAHEWGLDQGDIDAIATAHHLRVNAATAEQDAGDAEPIVDRRSAAAAAVARAHDALTPLTEPAAHPQPARDDARAAEPASWAHHAEAAADDGDGWSR